MAKGIAGRTQGIHQADGGFQTDKGVPLMCEERVISFGDDSGAGVAGVFTMVPITIPAGATIYDIRVEGMVLWNPGTTAVLLVGDTADPNGFYDAVDLKTGGDLEVGEVLNFDNVTEHAVPGVYLVDVTNLKNAYRATATELTAIVTLVGTAATTGQTRIMVLYACPVDFVKTSTFVAT